MTNNLITLTIPNDDHIALRAFGKALEEMALAHGAEPGVDPRFKCDKEFPAFEIPSVRTVDGSYPLSPSDLPEVDTTAQQVESLCLEKLHNLDPKTLSTNTFPQQWKEAASKAISDAVEQGALSDSTSTPWDERIHSTSKALNADGTWRLRRKPKDMDEVEWAAFVEGIKACNEVDDSPAQQQDVEQPFDIEQQPVNFDHVSIDDTPEPPVTPPGDDFHTDAGAVTEQTVAGIPPIPVPPPVVVPPVPAADEQWDFPKLMKFLTERHGKIDVPTVNQLLAVDGLAALTDLNANPDKIGPFVARVKAHLGE